MGAMAVTERVSGNVLPVMNPRIALALLLLLATVWSACSNTQIEPYHHARNHLIENLDDIFAVLGQEHILDAAESAPAEAVILLREYRARLIEISAELDAKNADWIVVEPSVELRHHYDLSTQMLRKLTDGAELMRHGVEEARLELLASPPDFDGAFELMADGSGAINEATVLRELAEQELTDLGLR